MLIIVSLVVQDVGCKPAVTPPPPPPPVPPKEDIQSPRRRLYRDVLAHRRAGEVLVLLRFTRFVNGH